MIILHVCIIVFWALFGFLHSLLASGRFKQKMQRLMGDRFLWYRPLYSLFALLQIIALLVYQFSIDSVLLWELSFAAKALFVITGLGGLVIMVASIRKYFFNLSGVKVFYNEKQQPVLEQDGLHAYVRHPLYGATLLFAWSIFFLYPLLSHLLACIMITLYTLIGTKLEEKKLVAEFGQQYRDYKNNVPMIIPFTKFEKLSKTVSDNLY